jgi:hypothetical protein
LTPSSQEIRQHFDIQTNQPIGKTSFNLQVTFTTIQPSNGQQQGQLPASD